MDAYFSRIHNFTIKWCLSKHSIEQPAMTIIFNKNILILKPWFTSSEYYSTKRPWQIFLHHPARKDKGSQDWSIATLAISGSAIEASRADLQTHQVMHTTIPAAHMEDSELQWTKSMKVGFSVKASLIWTRRRYPSSSGLKKEKKTKDYNDLLH